MNIFSVLILLIPVTIVGGAFVQMINDVPGSDLRGMSYLANMGIALVIGFLIMLPAIIMNFCGVR